jgi:hypothetical protein
LNRLCLFVVLSAYILKTVHLLLLHGNPKYKDRPKAVAKGVNGWKEVQKRNSGVLLFGWNLRVSSILWGEPTRRFCSDETTPIPLSDFFSFIHVPPCLCRCCDTERVSHNVDYFFLESRDLYELYYVLKYTQMNRNAQRASHRACTCIVDGVANLVA